MFVKICGFTRLEDAEAAVDYGASAIGFVFWPGSPRFVDPHRARAMAAALPAFVTTVGVFVNQPLEYVTAVASLVRVGAVQLHGDETASYVWSTGCPVVKAIPVGDRFDEASAEVWPERVTLLLDIDDPVRRGGTGRTIDWGRVAGLARRRRVLVAGGLTPENVAEAIAAAQPFGIDVSSGVEVRPGIKDHGRLGALFDAISGAPPRTTGSRCAAAALTPPALGAGHRRQTDR